MKVVVVKVKESETTKRSQNNNYSNSPFSQQPQSKQSCYVWGNRLFLLLQDIGRLDLLTSTSTSTTAIY